jgi:hypothetical protein
MTISLWKDVFRNDVTLPRCPPDLSEPRWAALLFGPDICEVNCRFDVPKPVNKNHIRGVEDVVL